jgi:UDP-glucose 4-epimerase
MVSRSDETTWLVTGAAGFLGSHVVETLLGLGANVVGLDNLAWGKLGHLARFCDRPGFSFTPADIRDPAEVARAMQQFRPRRVIHLAALHYIPAAVADPALAVGTNVLGTQVLLSAALTHGVERFWFASTGDVYGPSERPHREDEPTRPFNIYGLSKQQGEQLVALASRTAPGVHFVVGRLLNLYGPRETNPHILPEILQQLRERPGEPLRLGNLWPRRDFVPVAEAARAAVESLDAAPAGLTTVNVATGSSWSMQQVIDAIGELSGGAVDVETDPAKVRGVERAHLQADVSRLRSLIGWTPHDDLRRGLANLLASEPLAAAR